MVRSSTTMRFIFLSLTILMQSTLTSGYNTTIYGYLDQTVCPRNASSCTINCNGYVNIYIINHCPPNFSFVFWTPTAPNLVQPNYYCVHLKQRVMNVYWTATALLLVLESKFVDIIANLYKSRSVLGTTLPCLWRFHPLTIVMEAI